MKCAIIGAGIGGLTVAIALKKKGFDVKVYEAAPEIKPLGAGIVMATNAMLVFQRLDLAEKVKAAGNLIKEGFICDQRWKPIQQMDVDYVSQKYGVGSYAFHRAELHKVLIDELPESTVELNHKLISVTQAENKVQLKFDNQSERVFDFAIGADGIKSISRESLFGKTTYRYSGQTCWRSIVDMSVPTKFKNATYELWGSKAGLRFGIVAVGENKIYFFATEKSMEGGVDKVESLKTDLVTKFGEFGPEVVAMLEKADATKIIRTDIYDLAPISSWYRENVVLLGDAAHATTPNLGQGGCQAVEDAYVLANALAEHSGVADAFKNYQNLRFAKANYVVKASWQLGQITNAPRALIGVRNFALRSVPESLGRKTVDTLFTLNY
ncbi:MAG TPA: FAD-dependent monooxygenase [Cyclobacteriaceae bacterium]|jgi:2-polyprenyl-6-methoxyphenol hydroxylase-like FAD-dependent oxidoreductase|nr:FAD-dependent monooxygenase [Cyclobacteriaceae bacterium]